jgi:hypothetical protein
MDTEQSNNAPFDELTHELHRRISAMQTPEYRRSACYRTGDKLLRDAVLWLLVSVILSVGTVALWVWQ